MASSRAAEDPLQWGRRFSSAEMAPPLCYLQRTAPASMGPPIFIGGNAAVSMLQATIRG